MNRNATARLTALSLLLVTALALGGCNSIHAHVNTPETPLPPELLGQHTMTLCVYNAGKADNAVCEIVNAQFFGD